MGVLCQAVHLSSGDEAVQGTVWGQVQVPHEHAGYASPVLLPHVMDCLQYDPDLSNLTGAACYTSVPKLRQNRGFCMHNHPWAP